MNTIISILILFNFLQIECKNLKQIINSNDKCEWNKQTLACYNFKKFDEIDLSFIQPDQIFTNIKLMPNEPVIFESDSISFKNLLLVDNCSIELSNFGGFELFGNPFMHNGPKNLSFSFFNSKFNFLHEKQPIGLAECEYIVDNDIFATLFESARFVELSSGTIYSNEICPGFFKVKIKKKVSLENNVIESIIKFLFFLKKGCEYY
jgi:hypothetical protein